MKRFSLIITGLMAANICSGQAIWDKSHLERVRGELNRPMYAVAYENLLNDADSLLRLKPLSVMDKKRPSPSGDNHDYTSLARYFHPNPEGGAYIERDGVTNPEIALYDRTNFGTTADRIADLSLAWYFSGDRRYAAKATELLRVWFLNPATRMKPNMNYAQMVPGVNESKGRPFGVLDSYSLVKMLDGVALLENSGEWTRKDDKSLKKWMNEFLDWVLTSEQGKAEAKMANNHSTAYDAEVLALAYYTGRKDVARSVAESFPDKRIFKQVAPDGSQPHEMWRTLSFGYSQYNLSHFIDILLISKKLGIINDKAEDEEGRSFYKALDHMAGFLGKDVSAWPGKQIDGWDEKQQLLAQDLWRVYSRLDNTRKDYAELYQNHRIFNPSDRFTLLYYTPDATDDAYARASQSLKYAVGQARKAKNNADNLKKHNVSPRTINEKGDLVLVHPHDWTSGFFPGELWMMYDFTKDPYWREEAVSFTWPIEEAKLHKGTHDLGFMMDDSFGKGWELTGEKSLLDVVARSAETLTTRFRPEVGAIRSWDHNGEVWKYPVIIDNLMNLEMLFKMSERSGNPLYRRIAIEHADKTLKNHFREDGSSYHVVDYDPTDGKVRMKVTAQGFGDDSFWSRGQGWAIYGYTTCYRYTGFERYLRQAIKVADWWIMLDNMPSDLIPYWDMKAPGSDKKDNPEVPRDASAAAVIASALYELSGYADQERRERYIAYADTILDNLSAKYMIPLGEKQGFILDHSTGHLPAGSEIDVPIVYADYYFLEAMKRRRDHTPPLMQ